MPVIVLLQWTFNIDFFVHFFSQSVENWKRKFSIKK